jgi:CheY-like chemotaxis protein
MTAHAMKGDEQRCLDAGMDGYLAKPIRGAEISAMLDGFPGSLARVKQPISPRENHMAFDLEPAG